MDDNSSMQVKLCQDILVSGIVLDELEPVVLWLAFTEIV